MKILTHHNDCYTIIDAARINPWFAAHQTPTRWVVTHLPSGYGHVLPTFQAAIRFVRRLMRLSIEWGSPDAMDALRAWGAAHPWHAAWVRGAVGFLIKQTYIRPVRNRLAAALERIQPAWRNPIAKILDRRTDTCWADLAMYSLGYNGLDEVWLGKDNFWGNQVINCRRDARLCGRCYCGKFQNRTTAEENGWKPTDSRPIIVTSEITDDDRETVTWYVKGR